MPLRHASQNFAGGFQSTGNGANDPIVTLVAITIPGTVIPYFLKITLILSKRGRTFSLSAI